MWYLSWKLVKWCFKRMKSNNLLTGKKQHEFVSYFDEKLSTYIRFCYYENGKFISGETMIGVSLIWPKINIILCWCWMLLFAVFYYQFSKYVIFGLISSLAIYLFGEVNNQWHNIKTTIPNYSNGCRENRKEKA